MKDFKAFNMFTPTAKSGFIGVYVICGDFIQLCLPLVDELKNEYCCLLLQILVDQCFYFYFVFVAFL